MSGCVSTFSWFPMVPHHHFPTTEVAEKNSWWPLCWMSHMGVPPIAGWFIMEISQSKMMDELGVPPWIGNLHVRTRFCPFGYQRLEPICSVNYCKVNFGLIYPQHIPSNIQKHPPKMVMISMISMITTRKPFINQHFSILFQWLHGIWGYPHGMVSGWFDPWIRGTHRRKPVHKPRPVPCWMPHWTHRPRVCGLGRRWLSMKITMVHWQLAHVTPISWN